MMERTTTRSPTVPARASHGQALRVLAIAIALSMANQTLAGLPIASNWRFGGPDGGPVDDVAASATSLYAATQAGVYRSLDEGRHWTWSGSGMPIGHPILRLAISPTDPNVLWSWGERTHWRSGNGGVSWTRIGEGSLERFAPVAFDDETDGDSLVTYSLYDPSLSEPTLRHSSDGGASWQPYAIGAETSGWLDTFAIDARHRRYYALADGRLLTAPAGTGEWQQLGHYSYAQSMLTPDGSGQGLILGFQNIENYRIVRYDIPTSTYQDVLSVPSAGVMIADPVIAGRFWLQTSDYDGSVYWQLRESHDFGRSWAMPHDRSEVRAISADRHVRDRLYGTSLRGMAWSDDAGRRWETRTSGIPLALISAVAPDPRDPARLLAGSEVGDIWLSVDGGRQWSAPASGLPGTAVLSLVQAPSTPEVVFASTRSGLYRSDDSGTQWRAVASSGLPEAGGTIDALIVDAKDASLLTSLTRDGGLYWSDDGGHNWRLGASEITRIEAAPNGRRIYALQRPWPNATNWLRLLRADRHGAAFARVDEVTLTMALAVNPHADNVILALSNETGSDMSWATRLSSDGGVTWHERDRLFLSLQGTVRLRFDPCDSRTVHATTSGSVIARSRDLGLTWEYQQLPLRGGRASELSAACHAGRSHVAVHGGPRGVLVREPEAVDAIWRWGYDGD